MIRPMRIHSVAIAAWLLLHVPWAPLSAAGVGLGLLALTAAIVLSWTGLSAPKRLRLASFAAAPLILFVPAAPPLQALSAAALWLAGAALWRRPGPGGTALCLFSSMVLLSTMALDHRLGTLAAVLDAAFLLYAAQGLLAPARVGLGQMFSRAVVLAVPIAAVVVAGFAIFPTLSGRANLALPGLPAELQPGRFAGIIGGWSVAQVAFFTGPLPPANTWYWRSRTLDTNGGLRWSGGGTAGGGRFEGAPVWRYRLETRRGRPAVPLDVPVSVPGDTLEMEGWFAATNTRPTDRPRDAAAMLEGPPDGRGTRTLELTARTIFQSGLDAGGAIEAVDRFFREGGFRYTRHPGRVRSLGEFLAATKSGYCEHYAAAAANLLRLAGIPARVGMDGSLRHPRGGGRAGSLAERLPRLRDGRRRRSGAHRVAASHPRRTAVRFGPLEIAPPIGGNHPRSRSPPRRDAALLVAPDRKLRAVCRRFCAGRSPQL
jgi:hypothetical protein